VFRKKKLIATICLMLAVFLFASLKMEGVSNVLASSVGKITYINGIKLDKTSISMISGTTNMLRAIVTPPNKSVTWTSSNEDVVKVEGSGSNGIIGKVTSVGGGTAVITVTMDGDKSKTAKCKVTVAVGVTELTLDQSSISIVTGEKAVLKATVTPDNATNKSVVWSSTNPSVAKVDSKGNITALKPGTTIIKVTTKDKSKSAQCPVTVQAEEVFEVNTIS